MSLERQKILGPRTINREGGREGDIVGEFSGTAEGQAWESSGWLLNKWLGIGFTE